MARLSDRNIGTEVHCRLRHMGKQNGGRHRADTAMKMKSDIAKYVTIL